MVFMRIFSLMINFDCQDTYTVDQICVVLFVCMVCEALTMMCIYLTRSWEKPNDFK